MEELLADRQRVLGPEHPDTLSTRFNLARWRGEAAGAPVGVAAFEEFPGDEEGGLGPQHPDTLTTRGHIADWRRKAGSV
ncbi:hypothetical protein ADL34_04265 [Streptomyces sp. NRRL WC-3605]|nr:hypothetical protein ADL34_04265 [Streptomyces sp. NRRL WC-3605]